MVRKYLEHLKIPLTALAGAIVAIGVMLIYLEIEPPGGRYSDADIRALADEQIENITPAPPVEPEIFNLVRPAVVAVLREPPGSGREGGIGSGVVVDEFGNILTAYHVVAGKSEVTVRFHDGSTQVATVDRQEPERDLAVLSVDRMPDTAIPATLAGGVQQGDKVLALGAPFGLEGSLTAGVVSAVGRSFVVEQTGQVLTNMIQFDAAVNPGSSGGPLVDLNGRVVGIVTGIINPTNDRVFVGYGFAVPIEAASGVFPPLG
jgi:S1-C subfamily serine protease